MSTLRDDVDATAAKSFVDRLSQKAFEDRYTKENKNDAKKLWALEIRRHWVRVRELELDLEKIQAELKQHLELDTHKLARDRLTCLIKDQSCHCRPTEREWLTKVCDEIPPRLADIPASLIEQLCLHFQSGAHAHRQGCFFYTDEAGLRKEDVPKVAMIEGMKDPGLLSYLEERMQNFATQRKVRQCERDKGQDEHPVPHPSSSN